LEKERTDALEMAEKAHEERQEKESSESWQKINFFLTKFYFKQHTLLRILFTILKPIGL